MRRKSKKRPCRICQKWFCPDPRVGDRQKTCGNKDCQAQWHAKKCAEWNHQNSVYFREIYLDKKLAVVSTTAEPDNQSLPSKSRTTAFSAISSAKSSKLPRNLIQEVIGAQSLVIIEYVALLLCNSFQEVMQSQLLRIKGESKQVFPESISRGVSSQRGS